MTRSVRTRCVPLPFPKGFESPTEGPPPTDVVGEGGMGELRSERGSLVRVRFAILTMEGVGQFAAASAEPPAPGGIETHPIRVEGETEVRHPERDAVEDSTLFDGQPDPVECRHDRIPHGEQGLSRSEDKKIVHVAAVFHGGVILLNQVIDGIQIKISEVLTGECADRQPMAGTGLVGIEQSAP